MTEDDANGSNTGEPGNVVDLAKEKAARIRMEGEANESPGAAAERKAAARIANMTNCAVALRKDSTLQGLFKLNEFAGTVVIMRPPPVMHDKDPPQPGPYPRDVTDADYGLVQMHLQREHFSAANKTDVRDAVRIVGASKRFHPVRDWLAGLVWDRTPRLNRWLWRTYSLDAADSQVSDYHDAIAAAFLIGAVRRVRKPGCKLDAMLILEGSQGIGKSQSVRLLFGDAWFSDSLSPKLESRDAAIGLQGVWCVEFAEIEQIIRSEVEVIKAFISRQFDKFRVPYATGDTTFPRQCVLVGTTNSDDYLRDSTGNRRFWPVRCRDVDLEWLAENREQIWAEAAFREAAGEPHWLDKTMVDALQGAARMQSERVAVDAWHDIIRGYVAHLSTVSINEILAGAVAVPIDRQDMKTMKRAADVLRRLGWQRKDVWNNERKKAEKRWVARDFE